ncbi:hypothetical protein CSKR_112021, partial [Clonorchis sinensis]
VYQFSEFLRNDSFDTPEFCTDSVSKSTRCCIQLPSPPKANSLLVIDHRFMLSSLPTPRVSRFSDDQKGCKYILISTVINLLTKVRRTRTMHKQN